ncbi:MAG: hypothetical protein AABZ39_11795 [Spirochaetota bacterium]
MERFLVIGLTLASLMIGMVSCDRFGSASSESVRKEEELVIERLRQFLALEYKPEDIATAYKEFFSEKYKEKLEKTRSVTSAASYVKSQPLVDFELQTTLVSVKQVVIKGNTAVVQAYTTVHDRKQQSEDTEPQVFTLMRENGRWVMSF